MSRGGGGVLRGDSLLGRNCRDGSLLPVVISSKNDTQGDEHCSNPLSEVAPLTPNSRFIILCWDVVKHSFVLSGGWCVAPR